MIEVKNLSKNYGDRAAIRSLNFKIEKGDVVGLLGPNGAGKSTTMKILTGYMSPSSGTALVGGVDVFEQPLEVKKKIGYLPEIPPLYLDMVVEDYLGYVAQLKKVPQDQIKKNIEKSLIKTQLLSVRKRLIRNLSKGFKQRVGIAQALVSDPEILVLDEPTVGLDPKQVAEIRQLINELKGSHTIILSTHILSEVQATCNKVIIIHQGQIVAQDSIEQIEKAHQSQNHVQVQIKTERDFAEQVKKISGVDKVDKISNGRFHVHFQGENNVIEDIAQLIVNQSYGLQEISLQKNQLEDVFLKLTYGQQESV